MKRFIETTIWTQNKWFRKLELKYKLFWFYIISNCDSVGVWEEDFELASFIIGSEFTKKDITEVMGEKIKWFTVKKLWIIDFCNFQYGILIEENISNKPHQSYINQLKKHSLWIDYKKTIRNPLQRDKEKEKDKDKDKETVKDIDILPEFFEIFLTWIRYKRGRSESYKTKESTTLAYKKLLDLSNSDSVKAKLIVEQSMANNYAGLFELKSNGNYNKPVHSTDSKTVQ
ncbi:MAG: hypothetical protein WC389_21950 [Lutibacter sp.]|jgi:hypothetical protein